MDVKYEGLEIKVPTSWKDLKVSDYERFYTLKPESKIDLVNYVAKVCNIDSSVLFNSPADIFNIIYDAIQFVFTEPLTQSNKVRINYDTFFICDYTDLSFGEWVDIDSILTSENKSIAEILAICCRPIGEKYNPNNKELFDERIELFKNMTCDKALPLIAFFLSNTRQLKTRLNQYLTAQAQAAQLVKGIQIFPKSGGGIKLSRIWQGIKFYFLMRSLRKKLSRFSDSYYTKSTKRMQKKNNNNLKTN